MKRTLFFSICFLVWLSSISYAEFPQLPYLRTVNLKAKVTRDAQGIFTYTYEIMNGKDSIGDLTRFSVDISQPVNGISLSMTGLVNAPKHIIGLGALLMPTTKPMVPVGFPSVPDGWLAGPASIGTASWDADSFTTELKPGASAVGFVLQSWGVPTIRDFRADPEIDTQLLKYYPDADTLSDEENEKVDIQMKKDREEIAFKGRTIGPTAPPANFKPVEFLDYIVSLKKDSYYQGWIIQKNDDRDRDCDKDRNKGNKDKSGNKNDKCKDDDKEIGIMNSLDKKLAHARAELVRGDNREAIERLKSFMHEVAALYKEGKEIRHSHITSEAFALLYYNAEYLIDQLDGDKKHHHHKHHKDKRD